MPPEIRQKLERYHGLLLQWQKTINLVSPKTTDDAWQRHFEDSMQLAALLPDRVGTLYDIGSGAGFPGLVLAIMKPSLAVTLIESDARKCAFLQTVSRETGLTNVTIITERIETALPCLPPPDCLTARALAPLARLLNMTRPLWDARPLEMIFPKGRTVQAEINEARLHYDFDSVSHPSVIEADSVILCVRKVTQKA